MTLPMIGIRSWGTYFPEKIETAADVAVASGVPEEVIIQKMGLRQKHVAGPDDHCAEMAAKAGLQALEKAKFDPADLDLILYHGSEYKDHIVWSAATRVQQILGANKAAAFELYALCAGAPIALKSARAMMRDDHHLRHVLLVTASRENDLVDYRNERARFMFNFGAGGGAMLLERGSAENVVLGAAALSDGSLSKTVVMQAGGSVAPASSDTVAHHQHQLDVTDLAYMGEHLGEVSMPNFKEVIRRAVETDAEGYTLDDIKFLALVHMKRSFHDALLAELNLKPEQAIYLDEYGHMQSVDQIVALDLASQRGLLHDGDLVVMAGAGTGYTWSAAAIRWGQSMEEEHI
ncbi:MAG: 3-oxoacyl-ACP synthase [Chloroflexi bacterium]|nr:3-oxoacyl-ACP synthase [Chloroflexota bacterium]